MRRVVQRGKDGQFFDVTDHRGGNDNGAGEFVATMNNPVTNRANLFRMEGEGWAEQGSGFLNDLEEIRKLEGGVLDGLPLRANSSPCSSTENSYSAQNAVSNAMTTRHRMMTGETKMSEALLLFR
mgnify:CR=1 FL=1